MCMIEVLAHERFYKDAAHEPLRPVVSKGPAHRHISPQDVAPTHTAHSGRASNSSSSNSNFLKMFQGIFSMCRRTDQHIDVMDRRIDILQRNQKIIHS
jgi:hypothetical protein